VRMMRKVGDKSSRWLSQRGAGSVSQQTEAPHKPFTPITGSTYCCSEGATSKSYQGSIPATRLALAKILDRMVGGRGGKWEWIEDEGSCRGGRGSCRVFVRVVRHEGKGERPVRLRDRPRKVYSAQAETEKSMLRGGLRRADPKASKMAPGGIVRSEVVALVWVDDDVRGGHGVSWSRLSAVVSGHRRDEERTTRVLCGKHGRVLAAKERNGSRWTGEQRWF
jgi:hypothetical protein